MNFSFTYYSYSVSHSVTKHYKTKSVLDFAPNLEDFSLILRMSAKSGTSKIYGVFGLTLNPIPVHIRGIGDSNGAAKIPLRPEARFVSSFFL